MGSLEAVDPRVDAVRPESLRQLEGPGLVIVGVVRVADEHARWLRRGFAGPLGRGRRGGAVPTSVDGTRRWSFGGHGRSERTIIVAPQLPIPRSAATMSPTITLSNTESGSRRPSHGRRSTRQDQASPRLRTTPATVTWPLSTRRRPSDEAAAYREAVGATSADSQSWIAGRVARSTRSGRPPRRYSGRSLGDIHQSNHFDSIMESSAVACRCGDGGT